jgi:hypothetical protein
VLAQGKRIKLSFLHDGRVGRTTVDGLKIEQVLNNLVSNAIKYSYPDSTVQVRLEKSEGHALISVADRGQGIPADELDKLFQWFGRTRVKGTAGEKSTGLGLAIAQRIVVGHGGKIWVKSEVGRGSTFYVSLPLDDIEDDEPASDSLLPPETASEQAFDRDALLRRVRGDVAFLGELISLFLENVPELLDPVRMAITGQDGEALEQAVRKLKRSVDAVSAHSTSNIALQLAQMGQERDFEGAGAALAKLETEMERLQRALETFMARL